MEKQEAEEIDKSMPEEYPVVVENNPDLGKTKRPRQSVIYIYKYMNKLLEKANVEEIVEKMIGQTVHLIMYKLLGCSDSIRKLLCKRIPLDTPTALVGAMGMQQQKHLDCMYTTETPKLRCEIRGELVIALLDSGAEVNVLTRATADTLGLPVCTDLVFAIRVATGDSR